MNSSSKKGQVLSADIIIALLGFMGILVFLIWGWQVTGEKIYQFDETQDLYSIAYFVSESLVKTPGTPLNWYGDTTPSRGSIYSLGLANGSYLSYAKIESLSNMNTSYYQEIKNILGVLGPNYELNINYYFDNGTAFVQDTSVTFGAVSSSSTKVSVNRLFLLDNATQTVGRLQVVVSGGNS